MASNAQLLAAIAEADATTNEIADDLAELLARESISEETQAAADALVAKLRGVAAVVPEAETPPAEEPPAEPTP